MPQRRFPALQVVAFWWRTSGVVRRVVGALNVDLSWERSSLTPIGP